jgi:hypothetical protein
LQGEHGVVARGNPDLFAQRYEVLTIDDARALKGLHSTRPFASKDGGSGSGRKFFVIEADSITHEAQNALLKMFEEPNDYARFFLVIPSQESLLPTLRSRLFMVRARYDLGLGDKPRSESGMILPDRLVQDFLDSSAAERVVLVDKLAADISDGKKPKSAALEFCAALSRHLRDVGIEKNAATLAAIAQTESYLRDRAPSVKQLLEYVALKV